MAMVGRPAIVFDVRYLVWDDLSQVNINFCYSEDYPMDSEAGRRKECL